MVPLDDGDAQRQPAGPPPVHYDVLVIGSGPAGQRGAIAAAKLGKRVAHHRSARPASAASSVHIGTLPSKTMREAVLYLTGFQQRSFYGRSYQVKDHISVADLSQRILPVVQREQAVVQDHLQRNGVDIIDGLAEFRTPHTVEVVQSATRDGVLRRSHPDRVRLARRTRPGGADRQRAHPRRRRPEGARADSPSRSSSSAPERSGSSLRRWQRR